jgi:rhamnose transport system ATP-binding protein
MSNALLELTNITKSFGAVRALKGVSFDLRAGEVHALLGENGAGKSTLIKVITGAHRADSGELAIDGCKIGRLDPASAHAAGIAAIYQQPALFPDLSVAENIAFGLEKPSAARRVRWGQRRARARELLQRVGAEIQPETEVRQLSMPEQQLVEIARALGAGARVLIMDEPTASLTTKEVELLLGLVRDLRSQAVGIIYISHRLEEVFQIADRVTVLRDGESVGTRQLRSRGAEGGESGKVRKWESENSPTHPPAHSPTHPPPAEEVNEPSNERGLTESELIRMMVGREVSTIFPPAENAPGEPVISLEGVGCQASGVRDVILEVRAGEIVGLAGLVGAGRTELARVLFGITPADGGVIRLGGKRLHIRSPREAVEAGIGYVPEDRRRHGVILEMAIAGNITMGIHPQLFPRSWLRFGAENDLAQAYIRDLAIKAPSPETRAGNLSGGNQQKVALARWLAAKPKVLILDEPTQGVDIGAKAEIHKLIRGLAARGLAVLMISSELPEILGMSDRIAVMRGGTIASIIEGKSANAHNIMAAALGQQL